MVERRQVVEARGYAGVLWRQGLLPDRQRPLVERLGLGVPALPTVEPRQDAEARRQARVFGSKSFSFLEGGSKMLLGLRVVLLQMRIDTRVQVASPLLDLGERGCGPEPQNRQEHSEQAAYRHCAFLPVPRAQTNGRHFTITTLLEAARRGKVAGSAAHQPCTVNPGFRYTPHSP